MIDMYDGSDFYFTFKFKFLIVWTVFLARMTFNSKKFNDFSLLERYKWNILKHRKDGLGKVYNKNSFLDISVL